MRVLVAVVLHQVWLAGEVVGMRLALRQWVPGKWSGLLLAVLPAVEFCLGLLVSLYWRIAGNDPLWNSQGGEFWLF